MSRPDVSVLVVSWKTRDLTLACLDSLPAAAGDHPRYEVIVVDNGSRDCSAEALARRDDIELIRNERNRGYAAAVNQACRRARGELVLLLNSDVRLAPGSLSVLVRFLRERGDAAGVAPIYVNPDGSPQAHYYRLPTFATALALGTGLRRLPRLAVHLRAFRMLDEDFSQPRLVPQPSASCLLLRRSSLPEGDLLDERYPVFFNDVDLARRLARAGHELWMTPMAVAEHELGASTRLLGPALTRHHLAALVRYVAATESTARSALLRSLVLLEGFCRRLLRRPEALRLTDLWAAVRGDPGPLPDGEGATWVVYCSAIPWAWHRNRQQELAHQLARTRRVLFLEPPGLAPAWGLRIERLAPTLWRAVPPTLLPLGRFLPPVNGLNRRFAARRLRRWLDRCPGERLVLIDEDLAAPIAGRLGESALVYDGADLDWTFTRRWNRPHLRRALGRALRRADLVLASSPALVGPLSQNGTRALELLNGCDPDHFRPVGDEAAALAAIPRPRLGYVGALDERAFDGDLVGAVARLRPDWSLVLAGPAVPGVVRRLRGLDNVHLLPPVPYDELPTLLDGFDVCLIPYRTSGRAGYVHPKKLYEYLAMGKPVASTPLPGLLESDGPHHRAATAAEFVAAVEASLAEAGLPGEARRRRAVACRNSWDVRGERLRGLLDALEREAA